MSFFLKWLGASLLCLLPFFVVIDMASPGKQTDLGSFSAPLSRMEENVVELARATRRLFASKVSTDTLGKTFFASDPEHLQARDVYLKSVFERRADLYFYRGSGRNTGLLYELKDPTVEGPYPQPVDGAAKAIGINSEIVYHFRSAAFRIVDDGNASGEWKPGTPPGLGGFAMVRQGMRWIVDGPTLPTRR